MFLAAIVLFVVQTVLATPPSSEILVIVGAPGEPHFAEGFLGAATAWQELAQQANASLTQIGLEPSDASDRDLIKNWIQSRDSESGPPLWIVYLGHGTYSQASGARLNLRGPDLAAQELADALNPIERPLTFIHGGSASSPFMTALAKPGRIIITATQSQNEQNYARFGEVFAQVFKNPDTDIDRDGQVSVLEAFLLASQRVENVYLESGRLSTELALLDDTGDGKGITYESFEALSLKQSVSRANPSEGILSRRTALVISPNESPLTAAESETRDRLEAELDSLRRQKSTLDEDRYYYELERLLRQLAALYGKDS